MCATHLMLRLGNNHIILQITYNMFLCLGSFLGSDNGGLLHNGSHSLFGGFMYEHAILVGLDINGLGRRGILRLVDFEDEFLGFCLGAFLKACGDEDDLQLVSEALVGPAPQMMSAVPLVLSST